MPRSKGQKKGAPIIPTKEYVDKFVESKKATLHDSPALVKNIDRKYLLNLLDVFTQSIAYKVTDDKVDGAYRYTPRQMFENIITYFRASIENHQPITIRGINLFCGMDKNTFADLINKKDLEPQWHFMRDMKEFVEMYMEYTGQKKQNPAFQIFWLKNAGWKDKFEVEASSTIGALTDSEREAAQKRIAEFSEDWIIKEKTEET